MLNTKPNDSYTFEGASLLVDGYHSRPVFTSGAWLGYLDEPLDVTIDMGGEQSYRSVELETLAEKGDWIFPPSSVTVWVSDNGTDFTEVASVTVPEAKAGDADGIGRYRMQFPETSARYLKVVAQNAAAIPAWAPGRRQQGIPVRGRDRGGIIATGARRSVREVSGGTFGAYLVRPSGRCPGGRQDG